MENLVDDSIKGGPFEKLTIPIAVMFGVVVNIALLLNFDIVNKIPNIEKILRIIQREAETTETLLQNLKKEDRKIQKIFLHINSRNIRLKDFGSSLANKYLNGFELRDHGFHLIGEYWALKTYVLFWDFLSKEQEERKTAGNPENIIARVTHSNDVSIWQESYKPYHPFSQDLYLFQKKFVKNGGTIVRMLIGPFKEPDENYKSVISKMESIGIEVKYFHDEDVAERDFDFLFLADEKIVLKWFSGALGKRLAGCTLEDVVDDEVMKTWAALYEKCKERGDPVKSIPDGRQHHL